MVVAELFNAGIHDPVTPLIDVVGKGSNTDPAHAAGTAAKVGVMIGFTVIVIVVPTQEPEVGVNVYVVVVVLLNAGAQTPITPLVDVVGNAANAWLEQIGAT